jgi:hypothetical protein
MSIIDMAVWLAANSVSRLAVERGSEGGEVVNKIFHLGPARRTPRQGPAILKRVARRRQDGTFSEQAKSLAKRAQYRRDAHDPRLRLPSAAVTPPLAAQHQSIYIAAP